MASAALSIAAVFLATFVGGGGGDSAKRTAAEDAVRPMSGACAKDVPDCNDRSLGGGGTIGMCVEGVTDCVDMIVNGDGDVMIGGGAGAGECELIPDLEGCAQPPIRSDDGSDPNECNMVHNIDACGATVFDVTVAFNEAVTQADLDLAARVVSMFEPDASFLLQETFPPTGRATLHSNVAGFCGSVQAKLGANPGVASVTCQPAAPVPDVPPDAPVSSTPSTAA